LPASSPFHTLSIYFGTDGIITARMGYFNRIEFVSHLAGWTREITAISVDYADFKMKHFFAQAMPIARACGAWRK
jgi:hypothetical protein